MYNFNNEKKLLPLVDDKIRPQKENSSKSYLSIQLSKEYFKILKYKIDADKLKFYNNILIVNPFITDPDESVKAKTVEGPVYKTKLFPLTNLGKFNNRTIKKSGIFY